MNRESTEDELIKLGAFVARRLNEEAAQVMDEIRGRGEPAATAQAWIQMARLYRASGATAEVEEALRNAATTIEDHLCDFPTVEYLEVQMQVARAWMWIERADRARPAYAAVVKGLGSKDCLPGSVERHLAAVAEYRLAALRLEDDPGEALRRWRHVVDLHDEEVSPYAALRIAQEFGDEKLLGERVEKLFHYARGTSDPRLYAESTIGLARHLRDRNQFAESLRYLKSLLEIGYDDDLVAEVKADLSRMERHKEMAKERPNLRRLWAGQRRAQGGMPSTQGDSRRVIIVGAGTGGFYLREALDPRRYVVCGFVDDNVVEVKGKADDPILGQFTDLPRLLRDIQPDEVLLAIPTLSGARRRKVVHYCREASTPLLNLPGMHELGIGWGRDENRRSLMRQLRPVKVAETLGEEGGALDLVASDWLQYQTVLVIGAGAIGAELCRRLADANVGSLVVVDQRESALKKIENDLRDVRKFWAVDTRLGNAGEPGYLSTVFESCTPYLVLNATGAGSSRAFEPERFLRDKLGWRNLLKNEASVSWEAARAAGENSVARVVHISSRRGGATDDALGSMKKSCEELFLYHAKRYSETRYSVVRIGSVLDSLNGRFSMLEEQIERGAVVKAPPKDARAKFVPIWRWAEMILHASRLARGGEVFEPDGGVEISPLEVVKEAVALADFFLDDVTIEEADERWDEALSSDEREGEEGWEELGIWKLVRPDVDDRRLWDSLCECAHQIDRQVAGGSGDATGLVRSSLDCLRDLPVG